MNTYPNGEFSKLLIAAEMSEVLRHYCNEIQNEIKRIEAKKVLKLRLTERERAIWTLYVKKENNNETLHRR